jgi:hypothetical protein
MFPMREQMRAARLLPDPIIAAIAAIAAPSVEAPTSSAVPEQEPIEVQQA